MTSQNDTLPSREADEHMDVSETATPQITSHLPPPSSTPSLLSTNASNTATASSISIDMPDPPPPAEATQDTSANASSSEAPSSKDDDKSSSQPYGTRSRHRPGPRPNYTDDGDVGYESDAIKVEATASRRSTPSEPGSTRPRPTTETTEGVAPIERPRSGFTAVNAPAPPQQQSNGVVAKQPQTSSTSSPAADPAQPRQKRKYVWKNGSRPSSSNKALQKDGAAASSGLNASRTPEAPPAKKRKTGDGLTNGFGGPNMQTFARKPSSHGIRNTSRDSCVVTFDKSKAILRDGKLHADDGTSFAVDDHAYLICEPPGDPYYICRIMEFRRDDMNDPKSPVTSMIVNWFYRPKDIGRFSADFRFLFASMQSDESPINSLRGKCTIFHRSQINDLEDYKKQRDTFWFNQLYDRYIHRPYDMVPAAAVTNVPKKVKKAIDDRWKFLVVENSRMKELTSAVKSCKRCNDYCAPNDSVDCGVCRNTYHMACVRPPLAKKPSRGFAWSCGPCSRAQERRLQARHTSILPDKGSEAEDDVHEDDDDAAGAVIQDSKLITTDIPTEVAAHTQAEVAKAQMWPWRYLGIHCNVEDVLQYDDRAIYPRASSRLGARHQAMVTPWFGRTVELAPLSEVRKKYGKGAPGKKDNKVPKEALAALEAEKVERANRPPWLQDEPPGYVARGEDYDASDLRCTAERIFMIPEESEASSAAVNVTGNSTERICDDYMDRIRSLVLDQGMARPCVASSGGSLGSQPQWIAPTNYLDRALKVLYKNDFNINLALREMQGIKGPKDYHDPVFTKDELKRFEDGVAKFGSELRLVRKHVKSRPHSEIVRFYYNWKKTERGLEIWGRHDARRGSRKRAETSWTEIADDEDDSAFDGAKSFARKRRFECKFCLTKHSRQWRRAPAVAPGAIVLADPKGSSKDKSNQLVVALCQRCAFPWRRYAIRWEDPEEFARTLNGAGGRQWKRVADELMLRELVLANEAAGMPTTGVAASAAASIGIMLSIPLPDPSKKKTGQERDLAPTPPPAEKKKVQIAPPLRPPTPPIVPSQPRMRDFPCAVCTGDEAYGDLIACSLCRLTVHHRCYAVPEHANPTKWQCDTCVNDKNGVLSFTYNCVLCTVADRQPDMIEQPRVSHKKKSDRDRERERLEKILSDDMAARYKRDQQAKGRPTFPREPVKRTASNNWMHVFCAIWTPEIKFDDAAIMENAEGMGAAMNNPHRMDTLCKLCNVVGGACVQCHHDKCTAAFHVGCAHAAGYRFGFDIKPVKSTQKKSETTATLGTETGLMSAVIYCEEHDPATTPILHGFHEITEAGTNALEAFVRLYKQADKSLTGTARKANMLSQSTRAVIQAPQITSTTSGARRVSVFNNPGTGRGRKFSITSAPEDFGTPNGLGASEEPDFHECVTCKIDTSFRWWSVSDRRAPSNMPNGVNGVTHQQLWQCHKCHIKQEQGIEPTPPPSVDEDDQPTDSLKDYFELTMTPPPPPPPPQPSQVELQAHALVQLALQQPHPVQHWSGRSSHNASPESNGGNQADALAKWTNDLWASSITLIHPNNNAIVFRGREFGGVDDKPENSWSTFLRRANEELGYDHTRQIFLSFEGKRIDDCNQFIAALAATIKGGPNNVTWRIADIAIHTMAWQSMQQPRPYHQSPPHQHPHGPPPPPPPPMQYQQGPPPMGYQHPGPAQHPHSRPGSTAPQPMYGPLPLQIQHRSPPGQNMHIQRSPLIQPSAGSAQPPNGYQYPQGYVPAQLSQQQLDNIAPELRDTSPAQHPGPGSPNAKMRWMSPNQVQAREQAQAPRAQSQQAQSQQAQSQQAQSQQAQSQQAQSQQAQSQQAQSPFQRQTFKDEGDRNADAVRPGEPAGFGGPLPAQDEVKGEVKGEVKTSTQPGQNHGQTQGQGYGGASSSPDLRHLMH